MGVAFRELPGGRSRAAAVDPADVPMIRSASVSRHRIIHRGRVAHWRQLTQPCPVTESWRHLSGGLQRQTGLAHTAGPGQRSPPAPRPAPLRFGPARGRGR